MNRHWARICAAVAALIIATGAGAAQAQPDGAALKMNLGYDGKLLFLKVLNVDLGEQIGVGGHSSSARISSYGILDAFKHFNIEAVESGHVVHGEPMPGVFHHENHDGKRNRKVDVVWGPEDVTTTAQPEMTFMGDPPATRQQRLEAVGYLSAAIRVALASTEGPCHGGQMIFNGKELSELSFANPHTLVLPDSQKKLGLVNGMRCAASFREVAGYHKKKGKDQNQGLNRPIQVDFAQVGPGGPWVLAKLQAQTILGAAVIELARLNKQGVLPEGMVAAR